MTKVVSDDINALPVHMNKVIKMAATVFADRAGIQGTMIRGI